MQTTLRLLNDVPIGTMTPADWKDARKHLFESVPTNEGICIEEAWKLLDRLVEEAKQVDDKSLLKADYLNRVVGAWRSCPDADPEKVLEKLDEYAPYLLPDVRTYNMIVDTAIKHGSKKNPSGGPKFAEAVMDRMLQEAKSNPKVVPDIVTYNTVIDAWAKSGDRGAPQRAEAVLESMQELYKAGNSDVKPDTISFNSVLSAWAKIGNRGAAERAESILKRMQELHEGGYPDVKPNTISFSSVISAWANSGERGAARERNPF